MARAFRRLPFRYCEPAFFGGLLDDPLLFLHIRPEGRALLFDCGQIAHLAKRVVKPITAVFITHAPDCRRSYPGAAFTSRRLLSFTSQLCKPRQYGKQFNY